MDFYKQQDITKYRSLLFLGLFWLGVLVFTAVVYVVTMFLVAGKNVPLWHNPASFIVLGFTVVPIVIESLWRIHQLKSQGAQAIIERMDVRYVEGFTEDHLELRLKNVIEEMAIASNQPRPEIYVLNEFRINAITVATNKEDICMGVTQGALDNLNRDELQALVATQFAQIINGDVQFKTNMIGWLHGITFVQRFGAGLCGAGQQGVEKLGVRHGGAAMELSIIGYIFIALGYLGYLQALFIKRVFCRQRQYLADAFAVEYTRNPDALGGALKKSRNNSCMSMLVNTEVSHLFFTEPRPIITPTHPCIGDRLDIIYEGRPGRHDAPKFPANAKKKPHHGANGSRLEKPSIPENRSGIDTSSFIPSNATLLANLGGALPTHYSFPMDVLPMELTDESAKAAVFSLLGYESKDENTSQLINQFLRAYSVCEPERKLRLIDQAAMKIGELSESETEALEDKVHQLVHNDGKVDLFEFMVIMILRRRLRKANDTNTEELKISDLVWETQLLLSAVAISGSSEEEARLAFNEGARDLEFETGNDIERIPTSECHWPNIEKAIDRFADASDNAKSILVRGLRAVARTDGKIEDNELHLIQAVCAAIDMPMPELMSPLEKV